MAAKVNLDAMIPRADFAATDEAYEMDLFQNFQISALDRKSPIRTLLRKPDFQRETNHWAPAQVVTFLASFLDNELIPAVILWKSPRHLFVIDGGHRLSALRAWMEDDYGDGNVSLAFYNGEISAEQKRIAKRTRTLVNAKIGKYSTLSAIVSGELEGTPEQNIRASRLFTRALALQWVQGNAAVAESSFFKINSQGTPLDDVEEMLLRQRRKPVAVGARAIVRAGVGHKYWSAYPAENQAAIEAEANKLYELLFNPEVPQPIRTLDLPLGGVVSPVDSLSLLIDFLILSDQSHDGPKAIEDYVDDVDGSTTVEIIRRAIKVMRRVTGNDSASLGLHPAIYFYNERGKHSRFLFLGVIDLFAKKIINNDSNFFKKFTLSRSKIESFLSVNKSLIGILLQNTGKKVRVSRMREMFEFLTQEYSAGRSVSPEQMMLALGAKGRVFDITSNATSERFSDDTKSEIFLTGALKTAAKCPECDGLVYALKSVSYDHITRVREGGVGDAQNGQLMHPFCNSAIKN